MGILDFFRKKKKVQEQEAEPEEIKFNEIENWLDNKAREINEKEKKVFDLIKERIDLFIKEIDEKIKVLEEIDIESKKVEDRAKIIVRQGLDKYLGFVDIFIKELTKIEKQNLSQFIKDMNKIFSDFEKHSYIFYQRATFLIGDELAVVKQEINNFSEYFSKLFNEKQKIIDFSNAISSTKLKLRQFDETRATLDKIDLEIKSLDKKTMDSKEKMKKVLHEIEKVKASKAYGENLKNKEEIKLTEKQLEDDVLKLKTFVDFKVLSNTFHSDEKKMKLIKSCKEDFQGMITKDSGESILSLISESELDSNVIADKIKQINEKRQKITEDKKFIKKDEVEILSEEIQKIKLEIEKLSIEKVKHVKRSAGVEDSKEEIVEDIRRGVEGFGCKVI